MSQPWKLVPLGAVLAILTAFLVMPGGMTNPTTASADFQCAEANQKGTLHIQIYDVSTAGLITIAGSVITVTPNPDTGIDSQVAVDNGTNDDSNQVGQITFNGACSTTGESQYQASLSALPSALEDCDVEQVAASNTLAAGGSRTLVLNVDCTGVDLTPTATVGPAATVTTNASPNNVPCGGTSIVTIQVKDSAGNPVIVGTEVAITATLGTVSPATGQTTDASGSAYVFFSAGDTAGTAEIEAKSGDTSGKTNVTVRNESCTGSPAATPTATAAPPPTVTTGTITPPRTGNAGLASNGTSTLAQLAAAALLVTTLAAGVALVRRGA